MNKREIFDTVKTHLLTQACKSTLGPKGGVCAYRGESGMKCAVGCLIKDEFYNPCIEDRVAGHPSVVRALALSGVDASHSEMLSALQCMHDTKSPAMWPEELDRLEKEWIK